jgi:SAM-dependent methyltransferase
LNRPCSACGAPGLSPYLTVRHSEPTGLSPTTDHYGWAPDDLVRCGVCTHVQVARFPEQPSLDAAYGEAEDDAYLAEEAGQRATAAAVLTRIERHAAGVRAICDLGCFAGFLLSEAERRGWRTFGVEPSRFASEFARARLGLDVATGTFDGVELPESSFTAVVLADVIEHLPYPGQVLEVAARALAPGGVLYLALPDAGSRVARALGSRWWSVLPGHLQYFTRRSMATLLGSHGYAVEWIGTAPKAFTVRYYVERLRGYSAGLAAAGVGVAEAVGVADRLVSPDFRDRMGVVARWRG